MMTETPVPEPDTGADNAAENISAGRILRRGRMRRGPSTRPTSAASATSATSTSNLRDGSPPCSNCAGSGNAPPPLDLSFARSGELRGDLQRLADRVGRSPALISRVFSGDLLPGVRTLVLLADALGVSVDQIIRVPAIRERIRAEESARAGEE